MNIDQNEYKIKEKFISFYPLMYLILLIKANNQLKFMNIASIYLVVLVQLNTKTIHKKIFLSN